MKRTITAAAALIGLATAFGPAGTASAASLPDGTPVIEVGGRHFGGHRSGHRAGHRSGHRSGHRGGYHSGGHDFEYRGPGDFGHGLYGYLSSGRFPQNGLQIRRFNAESGVFRGEARLHTA